MILNHVNIRTKNLYEMIEWYEKIINLKNGPRPSFNFKGAWLYANDKAVVHLIDDPNAVKYNRKQQLEHFAFSTTGMDAFLKHMKANNVSYYCNKLPQFGTKLINIYDYDGNHIHVDFKCHEESDLFKEMND